MRIGIDCRMDDKSILPNHGFIQDFIQHLGQDGGDDEYVLFFQEPQFSQYILPDDRFQKVLVHAKIGSLEEQTLFVAQLLRAKVDCMYFPHFHAPLLYLRPHIITISDLKDVFYPDKSTKKWLSRYLSRFFLRRAVRYAKQIITWSQYAQRDIIETFNIPEEKIAVITPAIGGDGDEKMVGGEERKRYLVKQGVEKPYILFVGDIREYKNLPRCIRAYNELVAAWTDTDFVIIGREHATYHEVRNTIIELSLQNRVHMLGHISLDELSIFYKEALIYIVPSVYEWSGFPLLDAVRYHLPIACSDIPTLSQTIGEDSAVFFRPLSAQSIREALGKILTDSKFRDWLQQKESWLTGKFTWNYTGKKILEVCRGCTIQKK